MQQAPCFCKGKRHERQAMYARERQREETGGGPARQAARSGMAYLEGVEVPEELARAPARLDKGANTAKHSGAHAGQKSLGLWRLWTSREEAIQGDKDDAEELSEAAKTTCPTAATAGCPQGRQGPDFSLGLCA